jgi:hypothetical protein
MQCTGLWRATLAFLIAAPLTHLFAQEMVKMELIKESIVKNRKIIRYEHDSPAEWKYEVPQRDYFYVLPTKASAEKVPLRVVLHSAGGSGESEMMGVLAPTSAIYTQAYCDESAYGLYLDCDQHKTLEHWWGYKLIGADAKSLEKYKIELTPTERRLIVEIEWEIRNFPIDPDRVYLSGVSMGGSGSLGLRMCRGDLFAAINVQVPALPRHGLYRISKGKHSDPPPIINFSSQNDPWACEQEQFLAHCQAKRYAMAFGWGPHGHVNNPQKFNAALVEFPWLSIRRNEAYPVFTSASTDNKYPGFQNLTAADQNGQINAFFRWKNINDTATQFAMELRLVKKEELLKPGDLECPVESVSDVTLRRLKKFKAATGTVVNWQLIAEMRVLRSGEATTDASGLLTIPKLEIRSTPRTTEGRIQEVRNVNDFHDSRVGAS